MSMRLSHEICVYIYARASPRRNLNRCSLTSLKYASFLAHDFPEIWRAGVFARFRRLRVYDEDWYWKFVRFKMTDPWCKSAKMYRVCVCCTCCISFVTKCAIFYNGWPLNVNRWNINPEKSGFFGNSLAPGDFELIKSVQKQNYNRQNNPHKKAVLKKQPSPNTIVKNNSADKELH